MPEKMVKLVMKSATSQVDAHVFSKEEVTASCQVDLPEVGRLPMWGRVVGWSRPMAKLPIDFNLLEDLGKLAEMFQLFSKKELCRYRILLDISTKLVFFCTAGTTFFGRLLTQWSSSLSETCPFKEILIGSCGIGT